MPSTLAVFRGAPAAARVTDRAKAGIRRTDRSFVRIIVEFSFQGRPRPPRSKYKYANAWHQGASSMPPCNADTEKRQRTAALQNLSDFGTFQYSRSVLESGSLPLWILQSW